MGSLREQYRVLSLGSQRPHDNLSDEVVIWRFENMDQRRADLLGRHGVRGYRDARNVEKFSLYRSRKEAGDLDPILSHLFE